MHSIHSIHSFTFSAVSPENELSDTRDACETESEQVFISSWRIPSCCMLERVFAMNILANQAHWFSDSPTLYARKLSRQ